MMARMSSAVTTRWTPGSLLAAPVSIDLMRPCATVLRKIFPCSMPGSRMVWAYSAAPVTLSRASRRGKERPTCPPAIVVAMRDWSVAVKPVGRPALMHLFRVWSERLQRLLGEAEIDHVRDRDRAVDLLRLLEELPGVTEAFHVDVAVRIDRVGDDGAMHRSVLDV